MKLPVEVFGSRVKAMEIALLLKDIKPVVRQGYYPDEIPKVMEFCSKNSLHAVRSEFSVQPAEEGYSNKGIIAKEGMYFLYISKDELASYKAAYFEVTMDHYNLGLVLGYPDCCSKFFADCYEERSSLDNDYEVPVLRNSPEDSYLFHTNIFRRDQDMCLISHFPCSLGCSKSISLAKRNLTALENLGEEMARGLKGRLDKHGRQIDFRS